LHGQHPRIDHEQLIFQGASARLVLQIRIEVGDGRTSAAGWGETGRWEALSGWGYKTESINGWAKGCGGWCASCSRGLWETQGRRLSHIRRRRAVRFPCTATPGAARMSHPKFHFHWSNRARCCTSVVPSVARGMSALRNARKVR